MAKDWGPWLPSGKISWEDLAKTLISRPKQRLEAKASKASKAKAKLKPKAKLPQTREALEELGLEVPKELQEPVAPVKAPLAEGMEAPKAVEEPPAEAPGEEAPGEEAPQEVPKEPLEATEEPCAEGKAAWWSLLDVPLDAELQVESERPEVETPAAKVLQATDRRISSDSDLIIWFTYPLHILYIF